MASRNNPAREVALWFLLVAAAVVIGAVLSYGLGVHHASVSWWVELVAGGVGAFGVMVLLEALSD